MPRSPRANFSSRSCRRTTPPRRPPLLEQFASEFPKHEGTAWVLEQLQQIYVKANDTDKIIAAGDKLLALDPDDPEAALQCSESRRSQEGSCR